MQCVAPPGCVRVAVGVAPPTPPLRDRAPTLTAQAGLVPSRGNTFPCQDQCMFLCPVWCLCGWPSVPPLPDFWYFGTIEEGWAPFHYRTKWTSCNHTTHVSCGLDPGAVRHQCIAPGWILCTPSLLAGSQHRTSRPDGCVLPTQRSEIMHWSLPWPALLCLLTCVTLILFSLLRHVQLSKGSNITRGRMGSSGFKLFS